MYRTLIVNKEAYMPHEVVDWKDAVTRMFAGKLEVLVEYDEVLTHIGRNHLATFPELQAALRQVIGTNADSIVIKVPAVVRLLRAFRRHARPVKFSRVNIYARDNYKCQYCARKASISELTYDHVVPRSQGGTTEWTNIVTCCYLCNRKKGGRTPREAGMTLLAQPTQPNWVPAVAIRISLRSIPDAWRDYLYWTGELEGADDHRSGPS